MARGTGRKEDAQNIFVLCRNLVFSKIYSQRTQQACLGHCVRSLPRLLDMSQRRCHIRVIEFSTTSRILPTSVGRGEGTWNPTMSFMVPPGRCPKKTHTTEREPSIASEPIGLGGSHPIGQPGSPKLPLVTNRGGFDFMPIYKPYSGQGN
jgi:hypothetical protein